MRVAPAGGADVDRHKSHSAMPTIGIEVRERECRQALRAALSLLLLLETAAFGALNCARTPRAFC